MKVRKISPRMALGELRQKVHQKDNAEYAVAVISNKSFKKSYTLKERSYLFRCDDNYFNPIQISRALHAISLDGSDRCRLDWYLPEWKIEYCYFCEVVQ